MYVFLNSKFVPEKSAVIPIGDPGFLSGEGLFETLLVKDGKPYFFGEHLKRMEKGAKFLDINIPFNSEKIQIIAEKLIKKNKVNKAMLRITLTDKTFLMVMRKFPKRSKEASACFIESERCLPNIKSLNYLPSVLAQREAQKKGFDEALLVDRSGYVTEGGRTNFFWIKDGKIFTPPLDDALGGITREKVIQLIKSLKLRFSEKKAKTEELLAADEFFLTNAPMEIWPVIKIERSIKKVGEITKTLQEAYRKEHE